MATLLRLIARQRYIHSATKEQVEVKSLPTKKKGRHLLLGEKLNEDVTSYVRAVSEKGGVINNSIIIATIRYVGIDVEKAYWNVPCVVLSVRAWCMCCASVQLVVVVDLVYGEA